jgi:hypothetical protein
MSTINRLGSRVEVKVRVRRAQTVVHGATALEKVHEKHVDLPLARHPPPNPAFQDGGRAPRREVDLDGMPCLRHSRGSWNAYPALLCWANLCRALRLRSGQALRPLGPGFSTSFEAGSTALFPSAEADVCSRIGSRALSKRAHE